MSRYVNDPLKENAETGTVTDAPSFQPVDTHPDSVSEGN